eukprot:TRINITY_DN4982_c0_g1_i1.p1 TRINITY_DN4982_c0_g1~~TRINITY_DN4982_c0_g1_i1.p1  ORF type:complete len:695 (-),score=59.81 TRINITY_DN4982_c0_g1_i1:38-1831(-)
MHTVASGQGLVYHWGTQIPDPVLLQKYQDAPKQTISQPTAVPRNVLSRSVTLGVACGSLHSMILALDTYQKKHKIVVWGDNSHGQLGFKKTLRDTGASSYLEMPLPWPSTVSVTSVACGGNHSVAVTSDGTAWTWGDNRFGQLGFGHREDIEEPMPISLPTKIVSAVCGDFHTFLVDEEGEVYACGKNKNGQLGIGIAGEDQLRPVKVTLPAGTKVRKLAAGGGYGCSHTLAIMSDDSVWSWGSGKSGQLGQGNTSDLHTPTPIPFFQGKKAIDISCGYLHSCVVISEKVHKETPSRELYEHGLGLLDVFPNETLSNIFSFLEVQDLLSLGSCSRFLRSYGLNDVWHWRAMKDLYLECDSTHLTALSRTLDWKTLYGMVYRERFSTAPVTSLDQMTHAPPKKENFSLTSWVSSLWAKRPQHNFLLLGLDAAGKTTLLYRLKLAEVVTTIPTIGFNVQQVQTEEVCITAWDVGGPDKIRALWRYYLTAAQGLIFVIDSHETTEYRLRDALYQLNNILDTCNNKSFPILIYANKQDLPGAMTPYTLAAHMGLRPSTNGSRNQTLADTLQNRLWRIQPSSFTKNTGIYEGLEWLEEALKQ